MENFLINNNEEDGSSIFINRIREQDLSAKQKLNELKGFIEELARKAELKKIELERQAANCIDETLSQVELQIKGDEDYFTDNNQGVFANFFESLFNLFEVNVDPKVYKMLKEKKEKNLLLSIIKFLRDKLKELVKKIFKRDLSWDKRLDKEIKELQEKLLSGGLSPEEEIAILERLQALQNLKLKLQTFLVGSVIAMFAEIFAVDLAAVVEQDATEKDKDKKAEKTEVEGKEIRKEVEIKVNEVAPVHLFNFSSKVPTPITLNKQDRDLLPRSIKNFIDTPPKIVINRQDNKVQITGKMDDKDKKVKPEPVVCTTAPHQNPPRRIRRFNPNVRTLDRREGYNCNSDQRKATKSNATVELPRRLTDDVRVENHASSVKERGV